MTNAIDKAATYEKFVGSLTPQEFIAPFDGCVESAVASLISDQVFEGAPDNLAEIITDYINENLPISMKALASLKECPEWDNLVNCFDVDMQAMHGKDDGSVMIFEDGSALVLEGGEVICYEEYEG